ncbi:MAG TPA: hypothetical protein VFP12_14150 [Allosphingosinicella sp.]|nr:hypothetical protein [Allosphingosinicella sp.]
MAAQNVQSERDPRNGLRFYITVPEASIGSIQIKDVGLTIAAAEKLLGMIKKEMARRGAEHLLKISPKLRKIAPSGTYGDTKPCHIKRPKAGSVPAHYRVGLRITFNDPGHAQAFAAALGVS